MNTSHKTVTIGYVERHAKPTFPVTGAYGGLSADGTNVVAHLYVEYGTVPNLVKVEFDEQGKPQGSEIEVAKRAEGTREIQATVVMSPEIALAVGKFLQEKAEFALNARRGVKPRD